MNACCPGRCVRRLATRCFKAGVSATLGAVIVAHAAAATPATKRAGELTVALSLPRPALQVGAVRGGDVVLARGLEVDVARALAHRLHLRVRLVQVGDSDRLLRPGPKTWDVSLAQFVATPVRARAVSFTRPYLQDDPVVLVRRGLARPTTIAELRPLTLCVERGRRSADVVAARVHPLARPVFAAGLEALLRKVQTGVCDAGIAELSRLGPALYGRRDLYGGLAGRIETDRAYAVALERGSPLLAAADGALRSLQADGTLRRLATAWLRIDQARLRVLR
jgi:ABC-type amino acid transport substrate-binding protein